MPTNDHPVWEVYDLLRTCRLNVKYWSARVLRLRRQNFWLEYGLMATAPGSAVAGLVFWSTSYGKGVWAVLTTVAAFLAVAKPLLRLSDRLSQLQNVVVKYRLIDCRLEALTNDIRREDRYSGDLVASFKNLRAQVAETSKDEPVENIDDGLRRTFYEEVKDELPATFFYEPSK